MRLTCILILGLMAVLLLAPAAEADDSTRVFGTTNCQQKFSCSSGSGEIAQIASACVVQGLGISQQTGLFEGTALDSSNCMLSNLPTPNNGTRPSSVQCCITPAQDNNCSMRCQLLMY